MSGKLWNVSSSPHARSRLTTRSVMYQVALSLLPAALFGVCHFGLHALLVILTSVGTAVLSEFVFDRAAGKPDTVRDGSAVVTGLLLALSLPAGVPLYIPFLGAMFAIVVVKGFFGGLGHNFMNPALAARCFLLISFSSVMSTYTLDGVTSATPLAELASGGTVNTWELFLGLTNGVIGCSGAALLFGGVILLVLGGITFEIPAAMLVSFAAFIALFGGRGFDAVYLIRQICGGGVLMAAFFMATDPVTSPVTSEGQLLYGVLCGVLCGLFRAFGSAADSVSYGIIIANMVTPLIDEIAVPVPYGLRKKRSAKDVRIPKAAAVLFAITLLAGVALSGVYELTRDTIEQHQKEKNLKAYQSVVPDAVSFGYDDALTAAVEALGGEVYGTAFGKAYINEAAVGTDADGNVVGYVISATSGDGYDGNITLSVGLAADGTVLGIAFTELTETAGMGMLCAEDAFKGQFAGVKTDAFILNKNGGSTADNEIDSVSGASTSSGAVVNAVNAALDFYANTIA